MSTEFTNLQKKTSVKLKHTETQISLENQAKRFLPYDSILFSSVALIVNDGSSSFELDYTL